MRLSRSLLRVQDSHAYRNIDIMSDLSKRIFDFKDMFLSIRTGLSLVSATTACAYLATISGLDPKVGDYYTKVLELIYCTEFRSTDHNIKMYWLVAVRHQFCFFGTDLHTKFPRTCIKNIR